MISIHTITRPLRQIYHPIVNEAILTGHRGGGNISLTCEHCLGEFLYRSKSICNFLFKVLEKLYISSHWCWTTQRNRRARWNITFTRLNQLFWMRNSISFCQNRSPRTFSSLRRRCIMHMDCKWPVQLDPTMSNHRNDKVFLFQQPCEEVRVLLKLRLRKELADLNMPACIAACNVSIVGRFILQFMESSS